MIPAPSLNSASVLVHQETTLTHNQNHRFSVAQDEAILQALELYGRQWVKVAKYVNEKCAKDCGSRTNKQCADHFRRLETKLNSETKANKKRSQKESDLPEASPSKRKYSSFMFQQDDAILEAINLLSGRLEWDTIAIFVNQKCAERFGTKTEEQCRCRYDDFLRKNPSVIQQLLERSGDKSPILEQRGEIKPPYFDEVELLEEGSVELTNPLAQLFSLDMLKLDDDYLSSLNDILGIPSTPQSDACAVDDLPDLETIFQDLTEGILSLSAFDLPAMEPEEKFSDKAL